MTAEELEIAFDGWCNLAMLLPDAEQLHICIGFIRRDAVRRALLAGELDLDSDDQEALDTADAIIEGQAAFVVPLLTSDPWFAAQPPDHYAVQYVARHSPS